MTCLQQNHPINVTKDGTRMTQASTVSVLIALTSDKSVTYVFTHISTCPFLCWHKRADGDLTGIARYLKPY